MRFKLLLPLAAFLLVGSCGDASDPITGLASVPDAGNNLFTPLPDYSVSTRIVAANSGGTYVRMQGFGDIKRTTAAGSEDATAIVGLVQHIDASGVVFGGTDAVGSVYYWLPGGSRQDVSTPPDENAQHIIGRGLTGGEIIMAVSLYNPSATPASHRRKLYRWSSVTGWAFVAAAVSSLAPDHLAMPHGVTADGSIVWSRFDPDLGKVRLYRTSLSDVTMQYQVPAGHIDGYQGLADGGSSAPITGAVAPDGAVVGHSYPDVGQPVGVRWAADGTPSILPSAGGLTRALAISGDYIIGTTYVTANAFAAIRWKWNGSAWESFTFPALHSNGGPVVPRVNESGVVAFGWTNLPAHGITYGVPGSTLFRENNEFASTGFVAIDAAGRVYQSNGIITPEPELTTPASITIPVGVRMTLPIALISPHGAAAFPVTWDVNWEHGVSGKHLDGTFASIEDVRGVRHTYTAPGTYTVRTIVMDAFDRGDTTLTTVSVVPSTDAPNADAGDYGAFLEGEDVVLTAAASTDPNSRPLTYKWRFDGQPGGDGVVMRRRDVPRGEHSYRLIVENSVGQADTATGTIEVVNRAPIGRFVWPKAAIYEGDEFDLSVAALRDAPADIDDVEIQFNCGTGYGAWGDNVSKNCDGLPQGSYTVSVKLRDGLGAVHEYTGALTIKNRAPLVTIDHAESDGPGKVRVVYRISDHVNDGPWVVTLQRNGDREGGTQTTLVLDSDVTSLKIAGQNGDVITVRVRDKDGAIGIATVVVALDF